jgi:Fanconi-associated nuclease 1
MLQWRIKETRPLQSADEHPRKKQKLKDVERYDDTDESRNDLDLIKDERVDTEPTIRLTGLESALAPIKTDQDAIDEYESSQIKGESGLETTDDKSLDRLKSRKWIQGKSSIYVDAFNVALDTVLEEEAHLFNEAEHEVFQSWKALSYQAQYL